MITLSGDAHFCSKTAVMFLQLQTVNIKTTSHQLIVRKPIGHMQKYKHLWQAAMVDLEPNAAFLLCILVL